MPSKKRSNQQLNQPASSSTDTTINKEGKQLLIDLFVAILTKDSKQFDNCLEKIKKHEQKTLIVDSALDASGMEMLAATVIKKQRQRNAVEGVVPILTGVTPIIAAIEFLAEKTKKLLEVGANPNQAAYQESQTFAGYLPLALAIERQKKSSIDLLLEYGADPSLISNWKNKGGKIFRTSILTMAIGLFCQEEIMSVLIEKTKYHQREIEGNFEGQFPLTLAFQLKNIFIIKALIKKFKINLNEVIREETTFLFCIIGLLEPKEALDVLNFCHELNLIDLTKDPDPLYMAADRGKIALVKTLAEKIKDVNTSIPKGHVGQSCNALTGACLNGDVQLAELMFKILLPKGAIPNRNTIYSVARYCSFEMMQLLLDKTEADPDAFELEEGAEDISLTSALSDAASNSDKRVLTLLLERSRYKPGDIIPEDIQYMRGVALCDLLLRFFKDAKYADYVFDFMQQADISFEQTMRVNDRQRIWPFCILIHPDGKAFTQKCLSTYPKSVAWIQPVGDDQYQDINPLALAVMMGYFEITKLLLTNELVKGEINTPFKSGALAGLTLLAYALSYDKWQEVDLLVKNGADINATISVEGEQLPLLTYLMFKNNEEAFKYLLDLYKKQNRNFNEMTIAIINHAKQYKKPRFLQIAKKYFRNVIEAQEKPSAFFSPAKFSVATGEVVQAIPKSIQSERAYSDVEIDTILNIDTVLQKSKLPLLLHHAYFASRNIERLLKSEKSQPYYTLLMHLLRLCEALYGYARQTTDESFLSRQYAFKLRNIAAHLFPCLDFEKLKQLITAVHLVVFPNLSAVFTNKQKIMSLFNPFELYQDLTSKLNRADELLNTKELQVNTLREMLALLERLEVVDQLQWKLASQDLVDEVMMRFAIIGQYARLLNKQDALFDDVEVSQWLKDCIEVRNIVAHVFSEETLFDEKIFLPNKINKEGFFYMAEGLRRIQENILILHSLLEVHAVSANKLST